MQLRIRLTAIFLLTPTLLAVGHAQKFRFTPVKQSVIQQRMEPAPASQAERAEKIRQLFAAVGCSHDHLTEQTLGGASSANVICRLPGKTKESIIIGANYGPSVPDNWTAALLLPSMYESLVSRKRRHTFIFAAFADGSHDLAGSEFFARQMNPADLSQTEAMVNIEALGFSPTKLSSAASDKKLVESFVTVMYVLKQMASQVDIARAIPLDSDPFASRNIPQITIHSLTQDAVNGLQAQDQQLVPTPDPDFAHVESGFRPNAYYDSYHLISGYLAYLDVILKPRRK